MEGRIAATPEQEPNPLIHLTDTIDAEFADVLAAPSTDELIDTPIIDGQDLEAASDAHPPFPTERKASDFEEGQRVLYLLDGELVACTVESTKAYVANHKKQGTPVIFSDEELEQKRKNLDVAMSLATNDVKQQGGFSPLVVQAMIDLHPGLQNFEFDTDDHQSPGHVLIQTLGDPNKRRKVIIDMDRSELIPLDAWVALKSSKEYYQQYLASGTLESMRSNNTLEAAIAQRTVDEGLFREKVGAKKLVSRNFMGDYVVQRAA